MKITDYDDYRDYLKHLFIEKKNKNPKISFQSFATKVGVTKSYLKMIIDKKRHVSVDNFLIIADYFKMSDDTKQYIVVQILSATSKSRKTKNYFNSILKSLAIHRNPPQISSEIIESNQYDVLQMAIIDLLRMDNAVDKLEWYQSSLGGPDIVSLAEIKAARDILVKNKLIIRGKNGKLKPQLDSYFSDPSAWDDASVKRFTSGLNRTQISLNWYGKSDLHNPCRYHMYSLSLSHANVNKLTDLYDNLKKQIESLAKEKQKVERVMFISNNVFAMNGR